VTWNVSLSPSYHGLLEAILATHDDGYGVLKTAIGDLHETVPDLAPKKQGFNIEGMATGPGGGSLLIGLRNPTRNGKALLFGLENAHDLLGTGSGSAALGPVREVDLGGRGIRDIAWSPSHQEYLIISGQADDDAGGQGSPSLGGLDMKVQTHCGLLPLTTSSNTRTSTQRRSFRCAMRQPDSIRKRFYS
jgi:Protein of unknown function (DUF3616)